MSTTGRLQTVGLRVNQAEKFAWLASLIAAEPDGNCHDWPWGRNQKGYGIFRLDGERRRVGHVVLEESGHPRPSAEHHQLHSCDRPSCVAPWHLRWGTNLETRRESVIRGRHATKLTPEQALAIYRSDDTQESVARVYGITPAVVWQIKTGRTWTHVTGQERSA